jgi:hypothetical protein
MAYRVSPLVNDPQGGEITSLRDLDRIVELFRLEQLDPESLGKGADCLDLVPST